MVADRARRKRAAVCGMGAINPNGRFDQTAQVGTIRAIFKLNIQSIVRWAVRAVFARQWNTRLRCVELACRLVDHRIFRLAWRSGRHGSIGVALRQGVYRRGDEALPCFFVSSSRKRQTFLPAGAPLDEACEQRKIQRQIFQQVGEIAL